MTGIEPESGFNRTLFSSFRAEVLELIRPPGPEAARLTVARHQRVRMRVVTSMTVVLAVALVAVLLANRRPDNTFPIAPPSTLERTHSPEGTPTSTRAAGPGAPTSSRPTVDTDISISGPSSIQLVPANGHYEGQFSIVVRNVGPSPNLGLVYLITMPPGVRVATQGTNAFGPCMPLNPPDLDGPKDCVYDEPVPVGGSVSTVVALVADYAPGNDRSITGFVLEVSAFYNRTKVPADRTPQNNVLRPTIVLPRS